MADVDTLEPFEVLSAPEIDAEINPQPDKPDVKLCACGCGEPAPSGKSLKRGHTLAPGLSVKWDSSDLLVVQTAVVMMLMAFTAWMENVRDVPHMEIEEAQAIGNPVGRILARHLPLKGQLPGDIADGFAIASALFAYSLRISSTRKESNNGSTSRLQPDQTVSGLDQYAYKEPATNVSVQSENGNSR